MIPPSPLTGEGTPSLLSAKATFSRYTQTPISRALARGFAAASQFALCAHPTRRLHIPQPKAVREADALAGVRGRIPAPQNHICFAPAIRVSLNDPFDL